MLLPTRRKHWFRPSDSWILAQLIVLKLLLFMDDLSYEWHPKIHPRKENHNPLTTKLEFSPSRCSVPSPKSSRPWFPKYCNALLYRSYFIFYGLKYLFAISVAELDHLENRGEFLIRWIILLPMGIIRGSFSSPGALSKISVFLSFFEINPFLYLPFSWVTIAHFGIISTAHCTRRLFR